MSRSFRLALVGLLSVLLTLGLAGATAGSASAAPAAVKPTGRADSQACTSARQQDAAAAADVSQKQAKVKKATKKVNKARKAVKKAATVKNKKALKKAKKKNKKAKKALATANQRRAATGNAVVVFCGSNPSGTAPGTPLPSSTPGVSPLQPLCNSLALGVGGVSPLQPLCDATQALGNTSPLQPLCTAIPQLAPLCAVKPGDLADPAQVQALLDLIKANLPQGVSLITFVQAILTNLLNGNLTGVAQTLGTTPSLLAQVLRALGIPVPTLPGLPA